MIKLHASEVSAAAGAFCAAAGAPAGIAVRGNPRNERDVIAWAHTHPAAPKPVVQVKRAAYILGFGCDSPAVILQDRVSQRLHDAAGVARGSVEWTDEWASLTLWNVVAPGI